MTKPLLTKENLIRIKDEKVFNKLNEMYGKFYGDMQISKNKFFNDILKIGV